MGQAAELYLDPANATVALEETFSFKIKIDVDNGECINSGEVMVNFPESLSFKDFSVAESIFSLWIERPGKDGASLINDEGQVVMSGGIPGGYCGQIPGGSGDSNILGEFIFKAPGEIEGDFKIANVDISPDSRILINDGQGTQAKLKLNGANIRIDRSAESKDDQWQERLDQDNILPEPFVVSIDEYQGERFASFSTTDKQTGIDHYEVLEVRPKELEPAVGRWFGLFSDDSRTKEPVWSIARSPYPLKDQEMKSIIKVAAVDKAGNKRIVEYENKELERALSRKTAGTLAWSGYLLLGLLAVLIASLLFLLVKSRRK